MVEQNGLCQAPFRRYEHFKANLEQCGFVTSKVDPCLFINHQKQIFCLVYVDDVVCVAPSHAHIDKVLASLKDDFELIIEGDIQTFWVFNSLDCKMAPFNLLSMA